MLTPEQIKELSGKHLLVVGAGYVRTLDATGFARAIESEVRKDDESLIRWMLDALEYHTMQTRPIEKTNKVMAAARARLEKAP